MSVFSSGGVYILIKNIANNFLNCLFALCYAPEKEITFLNISYRYVYRIRAYTTPAAYKKIRVLL